MNTINVVIDFEKGINRISGIDLITGDYASTQIKFTFDKEDGTKVFEMKNPSGTTVYVGEIENNTVLLTGVDDDENYSVLNEAGTYIYEVSLYDGDAKLTSVSGQIPVRQEQVVICDETLTPYLPIFDELMQQIQTAITETNNLDIEAEKVEHTTTITITDKEGVEHTVQILDGEKGEQGEPGVPGAVKTIVVDTLPTENIDTSAIYLVPSSTPGATNTYDEYMYINNNWEKLGGNLVIDLTDYVKNTDYPTADKVGVVKINSAYGGYVTSTGLLYTTNDSYATYQNRSANAFIGKGTLENVITGKDLTTKSYVDSLVGDINSALDLLNGEVI